MRSLAFAPQCRTWLGIVDNIRAGFAIVGLDGEQGAFDPASAYIWTIEVLPAFRRLGIARQLLERVEESALEAGRSAIELHVAARNMEALALYEAHGFSQTGVDHQYYGLGQDALRYRKALTGTATA